MLTLAGAVWGAQAGHRPGPAEASWSPACKCSWPSLPATAWWTEMSNEAQLRPGTAAKGDRESSW